MTDTPNTTTTAHTAQTGARTGRAEGLCGEAGMSGAFERLHITIDYEEQQKTETMTPLMRWIRAKSQKQLIFCSKYCIL